MVAVDSGRDSAGTTGGYPRVRRDVDLVVRPNGRPLLVFRARPLRREEFFEARLFVEFSRSGLSVYFRHYGGDGREERDVVVAEITRCDRALEAFLVEASVLFVLVIAENSTLEDMAFSDLQLFLGCVRRV